jgi:hypothetical protein
MNQWNPYTPIEQATSILFSRRQHRCPRARDALEGYLGSNRFAVLFRPVATPNFELLRFAPLASAHSLAPLVMEYHHNKFVSYCNPIKHALARMRFHNGTGRNGGARITALTVADISASTGRILADVTTISGEPLIAFHHHLLSTVGELREVALYDASAWLGTHGPTARHYYTRLLSLFIRDLPCDSTRSPIHCTDCASCLQCCIREAWLSPAHLSPRPDRCRRSPMLAAISARAARDRDAQPFIHARPRAERLTARMCQVL